MNNYCISGWLSVDWLSNKLYYSHIHLEVIDLNNGYRKELNSTTAYNSIAVDPTNRYNAMRMTIVYHKSDATIKGIGSRYKALIVTILGWLATRGECAHARLRID